LAVGTLSLLWIASAFVTQALLGPSYSSIRYWIISVNLFAAFSSSICSFVSAFFPGPKVLRILVGLACFWLTVDWLITALQIP
jgi:hypothetical protein